MLAGEEVFDIGSGAAGTTFQYRGCIIQFDGQLMNVFDMAGLEESMKGTVSADAAFQQLYDLLCDLGGIHVLVFVTRFRITTNTVENYRLIRAILCGETIPIVVAITGREFEDDNERWWKENQAIFSKNGMTFSDHAIGTAHWRLASDPSYGELRTGLQLAICKYGNLKTRKSIPLDQQLEDTNSVYHWFESTTTRILGQSQRIFGQSKGALLRLYDDVLRRKGIPEDQARLSVERVKRGAEGSILPLDLSTPPQQTPAVPYDVPLPSPDTRPLKILLQSPGKTTLYSDSSQPMNSPIPEVPPEPIAHWIDLFPLDELVEPIPECLPQPELLLLDLQKVYSH